MHYIQTLQSLNNILNNNMKQGRRRICGTASCRWVPHDASDPLDRKSRNVPTRLHSNQIQQDNSRNGAGQVNTHNNNNNQNK